MSTKANPIRLSTRRRLWLLRLAALALSLTPLLLAEAVLRGIEAEATEAVDVDPLVDLHQLRPLFVLNDASGRWEIPAERYNFFRPESFAAEKPPGSRRIFVLGGSTVQGRPYATETSFTTWLRLRLQAASPETQFEVVNCGGVSYASYRLAKILSEVLPHQPDLIVIYSGHNEFLEDREYTQVREVGPVRRRIATAASKIRLVTWIREQLKPASRPATVLAGEVDTRLDHPGGLDRYVRDPAWRAGVEIHFSETLQSMIEASAAAHIPVVLCVPASELVNTPPFKVASIFESSDPRADRFDAHWNQATESAATVAQRLAACDACLRLDPDHAGANYIAGRLKYEKGETDEARRLLRNARDLDVCPLRATTSIVESVVSLAHQHGLPMIATESLLDQRNREGIRLPDGISDPEFFLDHVHPSIAGHQLIGRALFDEIVGLGWFAMSEQAEQRYERSAQKHLDSLGDAYYARGSQRLEGLRRWAAGRGGIQLTDEELQSGKTEAGD